MPSPRPNILLVTTDQQRFDTTGPAAPPFMRTPHLDMLASEGIRFSRCYAECPICVPSRVTLMSGRNAATTGHSDFSPSSRTLDRLPTIPTLLRDAGYQTAAIGKMHFGPQRARHGFDEMILPDDYYRHMRRSGQPVQPMRHGLGQNSMHAGMATVPEAMTLTSWCAEQAVEYILHRRDPTRPFFMWLSFSKPHPPLDPPEPYYSMYRDSAIPDPVLSDWSTDENCPFPVLRTRQRQSFDRLSPETVRAARVAYYGLITQCDYNLGRVLSALQDRDMLAETLVLFTSDHGDYLGDHRTAAKSYWHEPSAHVPLILRLPGSWPQRHHGSTCDALVSLCDILPTVVTAAGGTVPRETDGMDLTALARGEKGRSYQHGVGSGEVPSYFAITDGRWKFIHYPIGGRQQLFDLQNDPQEREDLAGTAGADRQVQRLSKALLRLFRGRKLGAALREGLPTLPIPDETEAERRSRSWLGLHTDEYDVDVRH